MHWVRFAVFVFSVMVLQSGLADVVALASVRLDLLLVALVFFAVYYNTTEAIIASFAIGFGADLIGPAMGPHIISCGLFGTLLAYLHRVIAVRRMPYQGLVIAAVGISAGLLTIFLTYLKGLQNPPNTYAVLLGSSLYSAVVGPFLFLPFAWLMRIKVR